MNTALKEGPDTGSTVSWKVLFMTVAYGVIQGEMESVQGKLILMTLVPHVQLLVMSLAHGRCVVSDMSSDVAWSLTSVTLVWVARKAQ